MEDLTSNKVLVASLWKHQSDNDIASNTMQKKKTVLQLLHNYRV